MTIKYFNKLTKNTMFKRNKNCKTDSSYFTITWRISLLENLTDCHSSVALDNVTDGVPSARGCVQPVNFDVSGSGVTEPPQGTTAAIDDAAEGASEAGSGLGSASMPPDMTMVDDPSGGGGGGVSGEERISGVFTGLQVLRHQIQA